MITKQTKINNIFRIAIKNLMIWDMLKSWHLYLLSSLSPQKHASDFKPNDYILQEGGLTRISIY
jgi:hypothetical protein